VEGRTIRVLPNVFSSRGIKHILPTQQTSNSTRCAFDFMRSFIGELPAQLLEAVACFNVQSRDTVCAMILESHRLRTLGTGTYSAILGMKMR
jgi:hypothetical protein